MTQANLDWHYRIYLGRKIRSLSCARFSSCGFRTDGRTSGTGSSGPPRSASMRKSQDCTLRLRDAELAGQLMPRSHPLGDESRSLEQAPVSNFARDGLTDGAHPLTKRERLRMSGAIDIVCNPFTPLEVARSRSVSTILLREGACPEDARAGLPMAEYVAKMDRAGIERSLLIAVRAGDLRVKHSFAIPQRAGRGVLRAVPGPLPRPRRDRRLKDHGRAAELERAITEFGFVGAHLYPHWFELPPGRCAYYPFYAKCCELDVPIMMQIGHCLDYQRDRILPASADQ